MTARSGLFGLDPTILATLAGQGAPLQRMSFLDASSACLCAIVADPVPRPRH